MKQKKHKAPKPIKIDVPIGYTAEQLIRGLKRLSDCMPSMRDFYRANLHNIGKKELVERLVDTEIERDYLREELNTIRKQLMLRTRLSALSASLFIVVIIAFVSDILWQ